MTDRAPRSESRTLALIWTAALMLGGLFFVVTSGLAIMGYAGRFQPPAGRVATPLGASVRLPILPNLPVVCYEVGVRKQGKLRALTVAVGDHAD